MDTVRWFEQKFKRIFGLDVVVSTSRLKKTRTGVKYFVYQCTRYVYHPETQLFTPHEFDLGSTNAELASLTGGLTTDEAAKREELIGPNFIEVYVPNIPMAILREFSSFFYIYQFTVLWLFYYFAYCKLTIFPLDIYPFMINAFFYRAGWYRRHGCHPLVCHRQGVCPSKV